MDYDEFRDLAAELVADFGNGGQATFTRTTNSGFDPITGVETLATATHSALVVVLPDTDASREEARVLGWDVRFACPVFSDGFVPEPGDLVELPGRIGKFTVIAPIEAPAPDGEVVMFTIRARQGAR